MDHPSDGPRVQTFIDQAAASCKKAESYRNNAYGQQHIYIPIPRIKLDSPWTIGAGTHEFDPRGDPTIVKLGSGWEDYEAANPGVK